MGLPSLFSCSGLVLFLLCTAVNVGFLIYDARLLASGQPTISSQSWIDPQLVIALLGWQLIGFTGLAIHLLVNPNIQ